MTTNMTEESGSHDGRILTGLPQAVAAGLVSLYMITGVAVLAALTVFVAFMVGFGA